MLKNWKLYLIVILGVHLFLLTQLKFTAWPEMLLWPYLMKIGWLPYQDIAIAHTPLLLFLLTAIYKIFGVGIIQLKIFTWVLILGLDILLFGIVKKIWNIKTALISVFVFVFWQLFFDGNGLWFDLLMGVFALSSYYFIQQKKYLWSGIFWVFALISKQTAIWFLIPLGLMLTDKNLKPLWKFVEGSIITLFVFILFLFTFHLLPGFYNWAIHFGIFVLPNAQGQIQLPGLKELVFSVFPFLIFIPLIVKTGRKNLSLVFWAFAGVLGAYPRFEYFHLQPALPFLAIATGIIINNFVNKKGLVKNILILYIPVCLILFVGFFMRNYKEGTRFLEADVTDLVSYVKNNTNENDKIFIMNWWDNIYPLTKTIPAVRPWVPQLSWYQEIPGIQEKEITDIKDSKPRLILLQDYADSGLASYKPTKVYDYIMVNYKLKEKIDGIQILVPKK